MDYKLCELKKEGFQMHGKPALQTINPLWPSIKCVIKMNKKKLIKRKVFVTIRSLNIDWNISDTSQHPHLQSVAMMHTGKNSMSRHISNIKILCYGESLH